MSTFFDDWEAMEQRAAAQSAAEMAAFKVRMASESDEARKKKDKFYNLLSRLEETLQNEENVDKEAERESAYSELVKSFCSKG